MLEHALEANPRKAVTPLTGFNYLGLYMAKSLQGKNSFDI